MRGLEFLLAVSVSFTLPEFMPATDSTGAMLDYCGSILSPVRDSLREVRLYVSERWGDGIYRLTRTHPARAGTRDTFSLDDSPPGRTFAVAVVDSHGLESCWKYRTVGVPPVGVSGEQDARHRKLFDVAGRRVAPGTPLRPGVYFTDRPFGRVVIVLAHGKVAP